MNAIAAPCAKHSGRRKISFYTWQMSLPAR